MLQILCWAAALWSAYSVAFAPRCESVTLIEGLALQFQCTLRCGLSRTRCYDIEQILDALIWEVWCQPMLTCPCARLCVPMTVWCHAACKHYRCAVLPSIQGSWTRRPGGCIQITAAKPGNHSACLQAAVARPAAPTSSVLTTALSDLMCHQSQVWLKRNAPNLVASAYPLSMRS